MTSAMSLAEFIETSAVSLFGYGIVNPFGPTFIGFTLCTTANDTLELVFCSLNPFNQSVDRIATYRPVVEGEALEQLFAKHHAYADIRRYLKSRSEAGAQSGTPTLLFDTFQDNSAFMTAERRDTARAIIRLSSDPRQTLAGLERFPLNVMERVSDEMRSGGRAETTVPVSDAEVDQILSIITDEKHLKQEMKGFIYGWSGAINFQRSSGSGKLAEDALQPAQALQLMVELFPSIGPMMGFKK